MLQSKRVLITAHRNPDGDSIGSQLGLAGFLEARSIPFMIVNEGIVPDKYRFLPGVSDIHDVTDGHVFEAQFDTAVVIECSNLDRIGRVRRLITDDCIIINIDHHQDNMPFGTINFKDINASAAGEMIYDILRQASADITAAMATNLYTAILTDTGRFHYSSTTPYCLRVASELLEQGANQVEITENVYYNLKPEVVRLTGMAIAGMKFMLDGRVCILTVNKEMMATARAGMGDTEGLVNYSLYSDGVEVGVLFTEQNEDTTKVSFRSQRDIDVAQIAAHYGGGGHVNASGCVVELPLEKARDTIVAYIEEQLNGSV
jgi:phosphoesterase RecJ-like protein